MLSVEVRIARGGLSVPCNIVLSALFHTYAILEYIINDKALEYVSKIIWPTAFVIKIIYAYFGNEQLPPR